MSRLTVGNVVKVALAVLFFPFIFLLVLMIGVRRKSRNVILEGVLYVALFLLAVSVPSDSALSTTSAFVAFGVWGVSAIRSYMLRDMWLHRRTRGQQSVAPIQPPTPAQPTYRPSPVAAPVHPSAEELSHPLAWVAAMAKQNKHRLTSEAYVTLLETCQTLDAVIDAERRQPTADARFEYELSAMVREYLPSVLQGYLAIPLSMTGDRQPNGRTPDQEFAEQLQLLSGQAEALHSSRHSQASAELTTTGNFLRESFGHQQRGGFDFGIE